MGNKPGRERTEKVGYRVIGIQPSSPAALCGFVPFSDVIMEANGISLESVEAATIMNMIKVRFTHLVTAENELFGSRLKFPFTRYSRIGHTGFRKQTIITKYI
jgi:hypothetical protein